MVNYPLYRHIENPVLIGHFTIGEIIAKGNFNIIHKGTFNDAIVAVRISKLDKQQFFDEILIFEDLNGSSNYVINYFGWSIIDGKYAMVIEYIEKDLHTVECEKKLTIENKNNIIKQIFLGIKDIHKFGYSLSDLKLENVLIDENLNIKLIDFDARAYTCGMFPPERLVKNISTQEGDIWLFGVTIYILYTSKMPFSTNKKKYIDLLIAKDKPKFNLLSPDIAYICEKCISYEDRIKLDELEILLNKL